MPLHVRIRFYRRLALIKLAALADKVHAALDAFANGVERLSFKASDIADDLRSIARRPPSTRYLTFRKKISRHRAEEKVPQGFRLGWEDRRQNWRGRFVIPLYPTQ